MKKSEPKPTVDARALDMTASADFQKLVDLLAVFSEATGRLEALQARVNEESLAIIDRCRAEYAGAQQVLTDTEAALELLARQHPDWFKAKKTITTPYGSVKLADNPPKLVSANPEVSIALIEAAMENTSSAASKSFLQSYIRTRKELDLENLDGLEDAELLRFRIKRVQGDTFTVKPKTTDLGQAVKAGEAKGDPKNN